MRNNKLQTNLLWAFLVAIGSMGYTAFGQQRITIGPSVQVSVAHRGRAHSEVVIAADPLNAKRLVVCSMAAPEGPSVELFRNVTYNSFDQGQTWLPTLEFGGSLWSSDPSCVYGRDGSILHAALVFDSTESRVVAKTVVYRSVDSGSHWTLAATLAGGDREFLTVDKNRGTIYLAEKISAFSADSDDRGTGLAVYRSDDGGASFVLQTLWTPKEKVNVFGNPAAVGSDGTFMTSLSQIDAPEYYQRPPTPPQGRRTGKLKILQSRFDVYQQPKPVIVDDLYSCAFETNSATIATLVSDQTSQVFRGRTYLAWPDSRSGRCEIFFAYSSDGGKTWSRPTVINDDGPRQGDKSGPDDFHPVLAVNKDGVLGALWYDRRNSADNLGWSARFSVSLDGGESFLPSVPLSDSQMSFYQGSIIALTGQTRGGGDPIWGIQSGNLRAQLGYDPQHGLTGGDTAGLVADAEGAFHPVWVDNHTGISQVWTTRVTVDGPAIKNGAVALEKLEDVSKRVTVNFANVILDRVQGKLTADAHIFNTSKETLRAPLKLRLLRIRSEIGTATILNPDANEDNSQGVFDFSALVGDGGLRHGERTRAKHLVIRIADLPSKLQPGDYNKVLNFANLEFRVLALPNYETSNTK